MRTTFLSGLLRSAFLLAAHAASVISAGAQQAGAPFDAARIPRKDVVVFVDVSGSITPSAGEEAGRLVLKLVTGMLRPTDFPEWDLATAPVQYSHFQGFLDGSAGGAGLTEPGRTISIERIGDLRRVREMRNQFPVRNFPADVERVFRDWPSGRMEYVDQRTYLNMAKAKARDYMRRSGEDGFYLFIVTDGADSEKYTPDQLSYIEDMGREQRDHLITKIHRSDLGRFPEITKGEKTPILGVNYQPMGDYFIEWYAVGRKEPKALEQPPPPPVIAPELPRAIQLLGGLQAGQPEVPKLFRTSRPYLAWQVANYTGMEPVGFEVEVMRWKEGRAEGLVAPAQPRTGSEFTRSDLGKMANENNLEGFQPRDLDDGDYQITIRPDSKSKNRLKPGEAERLKAVTYIRVSRRLPWWPWVAGAGALCGAALFLHMWKTLGTRRVRFLTNSMEDAFPDFSPPPADCALVRVDGGSGHPGVHLVTRGEGEPVTLRTGTEARVYLGALCDGRPYVIRWLELWVQRVKDAPGIAFGPARAGADPDARWERWTGALLRADPARCLITAAESPPGRAVELPGGGVFNPDGGRVFVRALPGLPLEDYVTLITSGRLPAETPWLGAGEARRDLRHLPGAFLHGWSGDRPPIGEVLHLKARLIASLLEAAAAAAGENRAPLLNLSRHSWGVEWGGAEANLAAWTARVVPRLTPAVLEWNPGARSAEPVFF